MAKTKLGNVKGPQGEQGVRGSKWYNTDKITGESTSGTAFPESGIADAMVGDMALNPTTLNLYTCQTAGNAATAKWVFMACIKGPQGPAGPKGDPTTVDAALSESSANPIQNKAVATKFKDVQDSLDRAVWTEGSSRVNDAEYCKSHSFICAYNGFSNPNLFGAEQMFFVASIGTSDAAYQVARAYNDHVTKSRKFEGGKWGNWA